MRDIGYWLSVIGYRHWRSPGGAAAISQGWSAAEPPETETDNPQAPEGRQKHNDMTTFDTNWEHEEQQGLLQRLRDERGTWAKRRRTQRTVLATVAVLAVAAVPLIDYSMAADKRYDGVVCNRSGIADSHWADVAGHILTVKSYEL